MVSIIIPCRKIKEAEFCINQCLKVDYEIFEIIVVPDSYDTDYHLDTAVPDHVFIRIIASGNILPSHKRDIGIRESNGDVIAFIDADAFPHQLWLKAATDILESDDDLAGVCGAGVIPKDASVWKRAADNVMGLLPMAYRVKHSAEQYVDDYPTFNLIFKRKYVDEVGGFDCDYLTGEDTLLCQKITVGLGKKILYHPLLFVYHDRRELFMPFAKQVHTFGKHRGYFFKRHPETSRRVIYILPVIGAICFVSSLLYLVLSFLF